MIEVGSEQILWNIMKIYSQYGINDFIIWLGFRGYVIKEYFANYFLHMSDLTFDMSGNQMKVHQNYAKPWRITLVDTGADAMAGGRPSAVRNYLGDETFCFTYGDGIANLDIDIDAQLKFHKAQEKPATVNAIQPPRLYDALDISAGQVPNFQEKSSGDEACISGEEACINGGFFVFEPRFIEYISDERCRLEAFQLMQLGSEGNRICSVKEAQQ
jgi:glucose-1-phosphate cytidylyltransferase